MPPNVKRMSCRPVFPLEGDQILPPGCLTKSCLLVKASSRVQCHELGRGFLRPKLGCASRTPSLALRKELLVFVVASFEIGIVNSDWPILHFEQPRKKPGAKTRMKLPKKHTYAGHVFTCTCEPIRPPSFQKFSSCESESQICRIAVPDVQDTLLPNLTLSLPNSTPTTREDLEDSKAGGFI